MKSRALTKTDIPVTPQASLQKSLGSQ